MRVAKLGLRSQTRAYAPSRWDDVEGGLLTDSAEGSPVHLDSVGDLIDEGFTDARYQQTLPRAGSIIEDTYRVLGLLGSGAMGSVFLARDVNLDRLVAMKFVDPSVLKGKATQRRLMGEARALARIRHPNVVSIFAFGTHRENPYFVMEYIAGDALDCLLDQPDPPPLDEAMHILDQVCAGVQAIHRVGYVHGDLKPSNILIAPGLRAVIADLGLSRAVERMTQALLGTPAYMAPEVILGQVRAKLANRIDLYALGIMAYELLTGCHPFDTSARSTILKQHVIETPKPPSYLRPGLTPALDALISSSLVKDPKKRIDSIDHFRERLGDSGSAAGKGTLRRILIADDDESFCDLLALHLEEAFPGSSIDVVADGVGALRVLQEKPVSVAIVDLKMPDLSGIEVVSALRALEHNSRVPVLVVTAAGTAQDWQILSSLGADGFLLKPLDPKALISAVCRLCAKELAREIQ
ncbi:MAG: protein kinase [Myxococcota bacterium]